MTIRSGLRRAWLARHAAWLLLALAVAGCYFDPYYSVEARASCAGADPARIRGAVETDPELDIERTFPSDDGVEFWCGRERSSVHVTASRSKSVVRVAVGAMRRPSAAEVPHWREQVDYVCGRLSATCPEIGKWDLLENVEPSPAKLLTIVGIVAVAGFIALAVVGVGIWLLVRWERRRHARVAK
jgi:hypothetical protein